MLFYKKADFMEKPKKQYHALAAMLVIVAFVSYLSYSHFEKAVAWDSAEYLSIAKSLYYYKSYQLNFEPEGFRLPFYPFLVAGAYYLFGPTQEAAQLVNPLIGAITLLVFYFLTSKLFKLRIALISTALLAFYYLYWLYTDRAMSDAPFVLLTIVFIFGSMIGIEKNEKKFLYASGIALGLAFLTRFTAVFLPVLFLIYLILRQRLGWIKNLHIWSMGVFAFLTMLPWIIYQLSLGGMPFGGFLTSAELTAGAAWGIAPWYSFFIWLFWHSGVGYIFMYGILFAIGLLFIFLKKYYKLAYILIWLIPLLYFSINPHKEPRYPLFIVPIIMLIAGYGLNELSEQIEKLLQIKRIRILVCLSLLGFATYQGGSSAITIFQYSGGWEQLKNAGEWLKANTPSDTVLMSSSIPQLHLYSERRVEQIPPKEKLENELRKKGVDYLVLTPERSTPLYVYQHAFERGDLFIPFRFFVDNPQEPRDFALIFKVNLGG